MKGAIDRALGVMPGGRRLRARIELRRVDMDAQCDLQVADWQAIMSRMRACGIDVAGARIVELGTGPCPTVPLCMYLAGAAKVFTFDRERRADPQLICELADRLQAHVAPIARESGRALSDVEGYQGALSHAVGRGVTLMVATANVVDYRAPADVELHLAGRGVGRRDRVATASSSTCHRRRSPPDSPRRGASCGPAAHVSYDRLRRSLRV